MKSINDIDFTDTTEYKVAYIVYVGKSIEKQNIYHFLLAEDVEETFSEGWNEKPSGNVPNDILMIPDDQYEYVKELKTDVTLDLAQDNTCFSLQDARDGIIALAYENLDEAEEYPENGRIVIHFGDLIDDVEEMLSRRGMRLRFI